MSSSDEDDLMQMRKERKKKREADKEKQKEIILENQKGLKESRRCLLGLGATLVFISLVALTISFGTYEWIYYKVNPAYSSNNQQNSGYFCSSSDPSSTCPLFNSRHRGMFMTCYEQTSFLSTAYTSGKIIGGRCVWEQGYNLPGTPLQNVQNCLTGTTQANSFNYNLNLQMGLLRAHWLAFAIGILLHLVSFISAIAGCYRGRVGVVLFSGIAAAVATFLNAVGMAFFHGYFYIENSLLQCPPFFGIVPGKPAVYGQLNNNTTIYYGYSFFLGWASVGSGILACIFLFVVFQKRNASATNISDANKRLKEIDKEAQKEKQLEDKEAKRRLKEKEKEEREKRKREKKKQAKKEVASDEGSDEEEERKKEKERKRKEKAKREKEEKEKKKDDGSSGSENEKPKPKEEPKKPSPPPEYIQLQTIYDPFTLHLPTGLQGLRPPPPYTTYTQ